VRVRARARARAKTKYPLHPLGRKGLNDAHADKRDENIPHPALSQWERAIQLSR